MDRQQKLTDDRQLQLRPQIWSAVCSKLQANHPIEIFDS